MDIRETVNLVRSGLESLQRQENNGQTIIEELEADAQYTLRIVQDIIDGMSKQRRLWITNDMERVLSGEIEPSGEFSVERWRELAAFFEAFSAFIETPITIVYADEFMPEIAVPPILIASRRNNPPANWGVEKSKNEDAVLE